MSDAAAILIPALITIVLALATVARGFDLVEIAHENRTPFGPLGGISLWLEDRAQSSLEKGGWIRERSKAKGQKEKTISKIEKLNKDLKEVDNSNEAKKIEKKIEGYERYLEWREKVISRTDNLVGDIGRIYDGYERKFIRQLWPNLGTFPLIHITNVLILWYSFIGIDIILDTGQAYYASKVVIALVWLFLPLYEVGQYNEIVADNTIYISIPYYIFVFIISALCLHIYDIHWGDSFNTLLTQPQLFSNTKV